MPNNISENLNRYLEQIFDTEDSIYKAIFSDITGISAGIINVPNDYDIGAIANLLEWNRNLSKSLLLMLNLQNAIGIWLDLIAHVHLGLVRFPEESDIDYKNRIINYIIAPKKSPASIVYYTIPFSNPGLPQLIESPSDIAYSDVTYASFYKKFKQTGGQFDQWWILPAIAFSESASSYFFVLVLQNTNVDDVPKLVDLVNRWKTSGINYEIRIETI